MVPPLRIKVRKSSISSGQDRTSLTVSRVVVPGKRKRAAVSFHCSKIVSRFGKDGKIWCYECSTPISVKNGNNRSVFKFRNAIDHATTTHLKKPLYLCKYCAQPSSSLSQVSSHLK